MQEADIQRLRIEHRLGDASFDFIRAQCGKKRVFYNKPIPELGDTKHKMREVDEFHIFDKELITIEVEGRVMLVDIEDLLIERNER